MSDTPLAIFEVYRPTTAWGCTCVFFKDDQRAAAAAFIRADGGRPDQDIGSVYLPFRIFVFVMFSEHCRRLSEVLRRFA
jgi:hypothetical protein